MKKKSACILALFLFLTGCSSAPAAEYGPDVENPYPILEGPKLLATVDMTPEELMELGASYVEGEIKELYEPVTVKAEEEWFDVLLEKNPNAVLPNITYYAFAFSVNNVLAGSDVPNEFVLLTSEEAIFPDELSVGDRFVLSVVPDKESPKICYPGHTTQTFYYISEENRVYPAGRAESSLQYTGMTVDMFKDALNK